MARLRTCLFFRFDNRFVFNMDETMLAVKGRKVKVICPIDIKTPVLGANTKEKQHITLIVCVSADGYATVPTAILPLKFWPKDLEPIVNMYSWSGTSSGWITEEVFLEWIKEVFNPTVQVRRDTLDKQDEPAMLWLDGHISRNSPEALTLLKDNNIFCATFPGHTSHILQPLDNGFFRDFKSSLRKMRGKVYPECAAKTRYHLLTAASRALYEATWGPSIMKCFEVTGVVPWNPQKILSDRSKVRDMNAGEIYQAPKGRGPNMSNRVLSAPLAAVRVESGPTESSVEPEEVDPVFGEESGEGAAPPTFTGGDTMQSDTDETQLSDDDSDWF